jgi:hypothetical protein
MHPNGRSSTLVKKTSSMLAHLVSRQDLTSEDERWRSFRRGFATFCVLSVALWILLYALYVAFPFVRNGADIVTQSKVDYLETKDIFSAGARVRVLVFGDSRTLASFDPATYSENLPPDVEAFNAGRPANARFLLFLKHILDRGTRPTHVLVAVPPIDEREIGWRDYLEHDKLMIDLLFPFRTMPRDLAIFLFEARRGGGIGETYREYARTAKQMIDAKGYYFIKGQSLFPGNRLPDGYRLPTDTPDKLPPRKIDPDAPAFRELARLAEANGFAVIFIPLPYRNGEFAAPDPSVPDAPTPLGSTPGFYVAGPSHWLYEPRYFSDPVHLNPEGAALYSRRLAALTAPFFRGGN